ncbi:MAG TPA: 3-hydroxyacyl-ACP dehydratase FabZ family protein [Terriglobia bacterium]|nr:3-hydroxyacyl-ACP dehydratase FabZ family protein [Terriglobia bacterium]
MSETRADSTLRQDSIQRIIPHRYPFLLVDRVIEFIPGKSIRGIKNFTVTEGLLHGFQPETTMVPCGILLEMVTQLGAILVMQQPEMEGKVAVILQIPSATMHLPVMAGESVVAEAVAVKLRESFGELHGKIFRGEQLVAEGQMRFAIASAQSLLPQVS